MVSPTAKGTTKSDRKHHKFFIVTFPIEMYMKKYITDDGKARRVHNKKDNKFQVSKRNIINKPAMFMMLFFCAFLFSSCSRIADLFTVNYDDTPYVVMESIGNSMEESGQEETESETAERKTYMTMLVEDYEIDPDKIELWEFQEK